MMPDHVTHLLDTSYFERIQALAAQWEEKAAEWAMKGKPRRAWYLEHMAQRIRQRAPTKLGELKQRLDRERTMYR